MRKIAWTQATVIVALLALAAIALIIGDQSTADTIIGGIFGVLIGTAGTTVVAQQAVTKARDEAATNGHETP